MLFTSSNRPQLLSSASDARKSHSVIVDVANSTYDDGFSTTSGVSRKSDTMRTRSAVWRSDSALYGIGRRSCTLRPLTPVQQRWSEIQRAFTERASDFSLRR